MNHDGCCEKGGNDLSYGFEVQWLGECDGDKGDDHACGYGVGLQGYDGKPV